MTQSPFDPDRNPTDAEPDVAPHRPRPGVPDARGTLRPAARIFVRGPWEIAASILIGVGVVMLMQPFSMWAYTHSFIVTLAGTVMFLVVSHFPE